MPDPLRLLSSPDGELPAAPCQPNRCTGGAGRPRPPGPLERRPTSPPLRPPADPAPSPPPPPAAPPPPPLSSAPRRPRRPLCPGREQNRGVDLPFAGDPAQRAVAQPQLLPRLGRRAVFHLHVGALHLAASQQLLLHRLPVGGVVDVTGDVQLGGPEAPTVALDPAAGERVAQAGAHPPAPGRGRVDRHLLPAQRDRPPVLGVKVDPQRHRLHVAARAAALLDRRHRRPSFGPHPPESAAERGQPIGATEAGEAPDQDSRPAHHPRRPLDQPGIHHIGVGDVLEPARDRVQPNPPRRGAVGKPGPEHLLEHAALVGRRNQLAQLRRVHVLQRRPRGHPAARPGRPRPGRPRPGRPRPGRPRPCRPRRRRPPPPSTPPPPATAAGGPVHAAPAQTNSRGSPVTIPCTPTPSSRSSAPRSLTVHAYSRPRRSATASSSWRSTSRCWAISASQRRSARPSSTCARQLRHRRLSRARRPPTEIPTRARGSSARTRSSTSGTWEEISARPSSPRPPSCSSSATSHPGRLRSTFSSTSP